MTNERLTPWYPGHIKPVRSGVYERQIKESDRAVFSFFDVDTGLWGMNVFSVLNADEYRVPISSHQNIPWRGIHYREGEEPDGPPVRKSSRRKTRT